MWHDGVGAQMAALTVETRTVALRRDVDVLRARQAAQRLATAAGLTEHSRARLDLVVSEITTNVVRHAGRGVVSFQAEVGTPSRLVILCQDQGTGFRGQGREYSDVTAGLGLGLAVVHGQANQVTIRSSTETGTLVEARVWD